MNCGRIHTRSARSPFLGAPVMTRKSRLVVLLATVATLPLMAACSDSPTQPDNFVIRRDVTDSLSMCGDAIPWGKAPCIQR